MNSKKLNLVVFLLVFLFLGNYQGNRIVYSQTSAHTPPAPTATSGIFPIITSTNASKLAEIATVCPNTPEFCGYPLAWSPDSTLLAVNDYDFIYVYDVKNWKKPFMQIKIKDDSSIIFSSDFQKFISLNADWSVDMWDVKTEKKQFTLPLGELNVGWAEFSPDGKQFVLYTNDYGVRVWNLNPLRQWHTWKSTHQEDIIGIFSPDSAMFAISGDSTVRGLSIQLWDIKSNRHLADLKYTEDSLISSMRFSPDGHLLSVSSNFNTTVWNLNTQKKQLVLNMAFNFDWALGCEFSPSGKVLACGGRERIYLWDITTGKQITMIDKLGLDDVDAFFGVDSSLLISTDYTEKVYVRLWDVQSGQSKGVFENEKFPLLSPDGTMLVTYGRDGTIKIRAVQEQK